MGKERIGYKVKQDRMKQTHQEHQFQPIYNENSRILILGTFPSVKSREHQFYYGHPQNRFWKILEMLYCHAPLTTIEEKKEFLLQHGIAIWDVIESCDIVGSSDSSIKNVVPTDLRVIMNSASIEKIYANGAVAAKLYRKYQEPLLKREIICLPSTSPANAGYSIERLLECWKICRI